MSDKHPIDTLFKEKLEGHKIAPSQAAWEKIATATQAKSSGFKPMYLMRAAAVVLLMGVSGLIYFQNNTERIIKPVTQKVLHQQAEVTPEKTEQIKLNETRSDEESITTSVYVKKEAKSTKVSDKSAQTYKTKLTNKVSSTEQNTAVVAAEVPEDKVVNPAKEVEVQSKKMADWKPKVALKLKTNNGVAGEWTKESVEEKEVDKKLKNKVFAYASDQMSNLLNGKKMNLPKTPKGKPSLEINIDKILN